MTSNYDDAEPTPNRVAPTVTACSMDYIRNHKCKEHEKRISRKNLFYDSIGGAAHEGVFHRTEWERRMPRVFNSCSQNRAAPRLQSPRPWREPLPSTSHADRQGRREKRADCTLFLRPVNLRALLTWLPISCRQPLNAPGRMGQTDPQLTRPSNCSFVSGV